MSDPRGKLVWSDEFEGTEIDATKWDYDLLPKGTFNNELQTYTNERKNSWVQDGLLYIEAVKEEGEASFTSARMVTRNKGDWLYGQVEVRAKIPIFEGAWPAIWMLPTDNAYGAWPNSGEIDIMEHVTCDPDELYATVHTQRYNHMTGSQVGVKILPGEETMHNDFHVYKMRWGPDIIEVGYDDQWYFSYPRVENAGSDVWPFKHRFHLLLNIAVAGDWGGYCLDGKAPTLPPRGSAANQMIVDWVRVYQGGSFTPTPPSPSPPTPDCGGTPAPTPVPRSCTPEGEDPYNDVDGERPFVPCCGSTVPCVNQWEADRDWFYKCVACADCVPPAVVGPSAQDQAQLFQRLAMTQSANTAPFGQPFSPATTASVGGGSAAAGPSAPVVATLAAVAGALVAFAAMSVVGRTGRARRRSHQRGSRRSRRFFWRRNASDDVPPESVVVERHSSIDDKDL